MSGVFYMKANTPDEARTEIVGFLRGLAAGYRTDATLANGKRKKELCERQAKAIDAAAIFIETVNIVPRDAK